MIENEYQHRLYNTRIDDQCIVYSYDLDTVLLGHYKTIDVDWSEPVPRPSPDERIAALEEELLAAKILLGLEE